MMNDSILGDFHLNHPAYIKSKELVKRLTFDGMPHDKGMIDFQTKPKNTHIDNRYEDLDFEAWNYIELIVCRYKVSYVLHDVETGDVVYNIKNLDNGTDLGNHKFQPTFQMMLSVIKAENLANIALNMTQERSTLDETEHDYLFLVEIAQKCLKEAETLKEELA